MHEREGRGGREKSEHVKVWQGRDVFDVDKVRSTWCGVIGHVRAFLLCEVFFWT